MRVVKAAAVQLSPVLSFTRRTDPREAAQRCDASRYAILQKIFFAATESSQAAGQAFIERLALRQEDREPAVMSIVKAVADRFHVIAPGYPGMGY